MVHSNHKQKESNRSHLHNKGEGVTIVQSKDLSVLFGDEMSLETINSIIKTYLDSISPSTTYH